MEQITRRNFIKFSSAAVIASASTGLLSNVTRGDVAEEGVEEIEGLEWNKIPCRFCGTGCGTLIGTKDGKIESVKGDPEAPVNRGLLCVKGYGLLKIQDGSDRLTDPLILVTPKSDPEPRYRKASWDEALDLIASKMADARANHGPSSVAMFGSGQWTIWEGYAAAKLWKGGIQSNSIEPNARHCMASAVAGFMSTFGMDEPMGCYDDFEHANAFVLWGANMAEMHPMLWARVTQRRLTEPTTKIVNLTVYSNRTSEMSDQEIIFAPQSDLAIANGIANLIIERGAVNAEFVNKHTVFKRGKFDIGYGLEDNFKFAEDASLVDFTEYAAHVAEYTPEMVEEISGVTPQELNDLADLYADPNIKVMSLWTMGVNQHTRGTWMNNLIYNLHLLTGKIAQPGNSPFSLTGQPSACGTAREVGTFTHRLPADMVVANPAHRKFAEELWGLPEGTIPDKPSYHAVEMVRAIDRGEVKFFWAQVTNPFQDYANLNRYTDAVKRGEVFVVVSDPYPTRSTELADVILPTAMWSEKEGAFGNSERRTHFWKKLTNAPGQSKSDLWQTIEVAKRLGMGNLFEFNAANYPLVDGHPHSDASLEAGFYIEKAIWDEYRQFGLDKAHDLAPFDLYHQTRGLRWPVIDGEETKWRYNEEYDSYVPEGDGFRFYGNDASTGGKANIWLRAYEPPPEVPDIEYPFWLSTGRVLEHWHSGTMTKRVPELWKAYPHATANMHPRDAIKLDVEHGEMVKLTSRRGSVEVTVDIGGRIKPPQGLIYVPWFDEDVMINQITLDAYCPISKQTDFKKCAIKVEKLS
jgi:nitrate reductase NapA